MKILVLSGSPHKNGNSMYMAQALCAHMGGDVTYFYAYDGEVSPCIDCGVCSRTDGCSIRDGAAGLLRQIDGADVIVLASPVYFSDLTGPLISAASRMQYLWMRRRAGEMVLPEKKRFGVILLSGGGSGKPDRALAAARTFLHQLGASVEAEVLSMHTDKIPAAGDTVAMARIDEAARRILERE
jgi:multimeric flavodoxin WrbA